jgi:hypothetical protein
MKTLCLELEAAYPRHQVFETDDDPYSDISSADEDAIKRRRTEECHRMMGYHTPFPCVRCPVTKKDIRQRCCACKKSIATTKCLECGVFLHTQQPRPGHHADSCW